MKQLVLVRGARQLLTLRGGSGARRGDAMRELGIIQDGALLIDGGTIVEVGPARRVENLAAAREAVEISADGKVVMPGFVDALTEPACGSAQLDCYGEGTVPRDTVQGKPSNCGFSGRRLEMEARKALRHFLRSGTTTLAARSGNGRETSFALKVLRAFQRMRELPLTLAPVLCWPENTTEGEELELLSKILRRRLTNYVEAPYVHSKSGATRRLLERAKQKGCRTTVTLGSDRERGVELALTAGVSAINCLDGLADNSTELLANSDVVTTLVPGIAFHRRLGRYPPARRLTDAGAAVAVATGFSSDLSPTCSMPAVLSLACAKMGMTPAEAITASTINAAHALGLAGRVGSLEAGKDADLVLYHAADYREIPYHFGMNLVAMTIKRGDVIYPRMAGQ